MTARAEAEARYLARMDRKVMKYDDVAVRLGRAVDLHAAVSIAEGWTLLLLASRLLQEPPCTAAGTRGDAARSTKAVVGQPGAGASQEEVPAGREGAGASPEAVSAGLDGARASQYAVSAGPGGNGNAQQGARQGLEKEQTAANTCLGKLPPFNRTATFHLCLRLAKGVLACWGRPLSGVRLELPSRNPSAPAPLLPKEQSCALLHHALACARLALLPAVWGRERVPKRTRAQLRAWWETYVEAAQHPEALAVGELDLPDYPQWTLQQPALGKRCALFAVARQGLGLQLACPVGCRISCGPSGERWEPGSKCAAAFACLGGARKRDEGTKVL